MKGEREGNQDDDVLLPEGCKNNYFDILLMNQAQNLPKYSNKKALFAFWMPVILNDLVFFYLITICLLTLYKKD